jgi:hypothetical protein
MKLFVKPLLPALARFPLSMRPLELFGRNAIDH